MIMIVLVVVLDSVAITAFYTLHFNREPGTRQQTFVGVWTLLSFLVVAVQLRKIRAARRATLGPLSARMARSADASRVDSPPSSAAGSGETSGQGDGPSTTTGSGSS